MSEIEKRELAVKNACEVVAKKMGPKIRQMSWFASSATNKKILKAA
jgi:hypothetical protein